ncbi:MAG: threonine transporter [Alphaproteobacteria bacterium]|nr:threonine transporter [Alphaproteobacteria bacterium]
MVEAVARRKAPATFNGALEAGVRAVALLAAAHPYSFDLQRLIAFDYLLVHTGDVGGPESLHPPAPLHSAELLVRRKLVEQALLLMMTRDLVRREVSAEGIRYRAGENATPFLQALQSSYLGALKDRAEWLVGEFGALSDTEFRVLMRRFFDRWVEEFQVAERSLGVES